ncbi:MAG: PHP domain-containing protein, partial [Pseudomonadota bacterium]
MSDRLPFVHLAVRSNYSLLQSMVTIKQLVSWCAEQAMPAVAITDRNNMFGALEFSETAAGAGLQPIMAVCFDVTDGAHQETCSRVSLYAQNDTGYQRLMYLASQAYLDNEDGVPRIHESYLQAETEGLLLLTGGVQGRVAQHLLKGRTSDARTVLERYAADFPGRCYVEITRHGTADERITEPGLLDLAYDLELPIVATHDARFMAPGDAAAHDAMMCIANGAYLGQDDRPTVAPDQYLKTAEEMAILFADLPEALETTVEIAQRCSVRAITHKPILPHFTDGDQSESEALRLQAEAGLERRLAAAPKLYATRETYFERLNYELSIIDRMGFPGYFLIVADFIKWTREQGIPVGPGRGSGAGSVVAWVLTITDLDPLRFDLLFER